MARRYNVPSYSEGFVEYVRNVATVFNAFFAEVSNVQDNITAGSVQTQSGATPLVLGSNRVTSASVNDGVRLPLTTGGGECFIRNDSGAAIKVWPQSGGKINGGSANAADSSTLTTGSSRTYRAMDEENWYD